MIKEINTPFVWYDDILKQNRYNTYCDAICDYKLISPTDTLLPFQIKTNEATYLIQSWKLYCADDDSLYVDLSAYIGELQTFAPRNDYYYIVYTPTMSFAEELECGSYYSIVSGITQSGASFGTFLYYSEVFNVVDFSDDSGIQDSFPLFTPFRWYNNILKQNRYKEYCSATCDYCLITLEDTIPTFQIRTDILSSTVIGLHSWKLYCSTGEEFVDLSGASLLFSLVFVNNADGYKYISYHGGTLTGINIPCGMYYSVLEVIDLSLNVTSFYSELFCVKSDISDDTTNYLQTDSGVNLTDDDGNFLMVD